METISVMKNNKIDRLHDIITALGLVAMNALEGWDKSYVIDRVKSLVAEADALCEHPERKDHSMDPD